MFYENWENQAAHARHCEMPYIKVWKEIKDELLAKPYEVTFWERLTQV